MKLQLVTIAASAFMASSLVSAAGNNAADDPCAILATQARLLAAHTTDGTTADPFPVVTADEALACYKSFSVSVADKKAQIDAVKSYFQLYPYVDIAKKSEAPNFPLNVDIFATLDAIANDNTVNTEYLLQSKIGRLVTSLNDAHAFYQSLCFTTVRFLQPFVIAAKYPTGGAGGAPTLYIKGPVSQVSELFSAVNLGKAPYLKGVASALDSFWTPKLNGVAPTDFTDYTVSTINGMDAISFYQYIADLTTGYSRDPQTRFNSILPYANYIGTGSFIFFDSSVYRTRTFGFDYNTTYTYGLVAPNGTKVSVEAPWGAYLALPLNSKPAQLPLYTRDDFYQNLCTDPNSDMMRSTPPLPGSTGSTGSTGGSTTGSSSSTATSATVSTTGTAPAAASEPTSPSALASRDIIRRHIFADGNLFSNSEYVSDLRVLQRPVTSFKSSPATSSYIFNNINWDLVSTLHDQKSAIAISRANQQSFDLKSGLGKSFNINQFVNTSTDSNHEFSSFATGRMIQADDYNAIYNLDGVNGLWAFTTVEPADDNAGGDFLSTVTAGLRGLETAGVNNLIIDTSDNGGGQICLGVALLTYILNKPTALPYDIRLTDPVKFLMTNADTNTDVAGSTIFSSQGLLAYDTKTPVLDLSKTGGSLTRGGVSEGYTEKFLLDCGPGINSILKKLTPLQKGWAPSNIFLLSNGKCGSTCAEFTRVARDQYGVRTLTYGGASSTPFQPSSFEGGVVQDYGAFYNDTQAILAVLPSSTLSKNSDVVNSLPQTLPLYITGSLPFWESYSPQGKGGLDTPCEFVPQNSEAYVSGVVDWIDKPSLWSAAVDVITKQFNPANNAGAAVGGPKSGGGRVTVQSGGVVLGGLLMMVMMMVL
ncbi:hypothetical protein HDU76_004134 [Blyttiomyces sp. JEL0837]|nr:hypothetical protein HDU76_004134 [Blyttiomyces sp. JEL0837]